MPDFYGNAAGFQTYHTERGRDITDYGDPEIEAALLVASEWLDGAYGSSWSGYKVNGRSQVRDWPRSGAYDMDCDPIPDDEVPVEVQQATYEAALRHLQSPGVFNVDYTPSKYTEARVEGAVSVKYADRDAWSIQTQFPAIAQILAPILNGYGAMSALSGPTGRA